MHIHILMLCSKFELIPTKIDFKNKFIKLPQSHVHVLLVSSLSIIFLQKTLPFDIIIVIYFDLTVTLENTFLLDT